ncbi:flagellar basal body P-ring formation chaperone FlgA [Ramlibacter sp. MAHUQ-53]|uniref:flagellar basal body P-ring formation chaperone FlgA n=1 Tax=unclassified Ramlibacter TaxID=2617605 RepID=UPI00363A471D
MNRRPARRARRAPSPLAALLLAGLAGLSALAAAPARAQVSFDEGVLRAWLQQQLAATAVREGLTRYEVQGLGPVESAATLAPCRRAEPFVPPGLRAWGRVTFGVRCVDGAAWSVLVPAQVAAWGPAVVAAAPLPAGAVLGEADLRVQEVELTREAPGVARDPQALAGKALVRAVAAGQPLRPELARAPAALQAGDPVRLRIQGPGFAITGAGQALAGAALGQPVRVRTELGKVLQGVAREGRVVEVAL